VKLAAVLLVVAAHTSAAQPAREDRDADADKAAVARAAAVAREADSAARSHYRAHDYAAAIDDYRRAHDALPDPLFLFDMAQAYRKLSDCAHAAELYRAYLQDRPDADNRAKVERFIRTMDACTPPPPPEQPPPMPQPEPAPVSTESNARAWQFMGIGTGTIGLFLVGAGVYFSNDAGRAQTEIEAACANGCRGADVHALDASGHDANRNAAITYSIGGAALAAGAGMILWSLLGNPSDTAPAVAPVAGGAILSGQGRF
jgi:tetratricopeptide (TPR) repeat protein